MMAAATSDRCHCNTTKRVPKPHCNLLPAPYAARTSQSISTVWRPKGGVCALLMGRATTFQHQSNIATYNVQQTQTLA